MHKNYTYTSVFNDLINGFISSQRESGFLYDNPAYWLYRFDQYCVANKVKISVITRDLFEAWGARLESESKTTQSNRVQALRKFSIYLTTLGMHSYIPQNIPRPEKNIPYLMTDTDIREFFEQVDQCETKSHVLSFKRMAQEYKVLFRLIYSCGLRNNEACMLKNSDVNLADGIITIRHSKGSKDRLVYMADDLRDLCADYQRWINKQPDMPSEWFFPGKCPEECIPKTSADRKFNEFWNATAASKYCDKKPTVHCLRHAFVIKRVNTWMESDIPLQVMMPYLSSFLGHKGPVETYYYYHQVEDVFRTVRRKDRISANVIPEVQHEK